MKKRKKKISQLQQQKLNLAQHRNLFFERLRSLLCVMGVPQVYKAFSAELLDYFYLARCQCIRVIVAEGNTVPDNVVYTGIDVFSRVFKNRKVPLLPDGSIEVSLYDFSTVYETLLCTITNVKYGTDPKTLPIRESLKPFIDSYDEMHDKAAKSIGNLLNVLNFYPSDFRQRIYMHIHRIETEWAGKIGLISLCEIRSSVPEKRSFVIDGISRTAYRVGWAEYRVRLGFRYASLTPEQLQINMLTKDFQMPVFIQSHAIQRLLERLDNVVPGLIFVNVLHAVKYELSVHRDKNGTIMLAMHLQKLKVGYLVADIIDRCVVLRTFLFLTQFGTPEGDKLKTMTGLEKLDSNYFDITKLSTFLESDIPKNEKLKALFIEAGCESLFNLDHAAIANNLEFKERTCADKIVDYLGLNRSDEEYSDEFDCTDES